MSGREQFFGIVRNGEFYVFAPQQLEGTIVKLTSNKFNESPESGIIDLTKFEGKIIEVSGQEGEEWIYTAKVEEEAGPVLSNFLKKVFLKDEVRQKRCVLIIGQENESNGIINKNMNVNELAFNKKLAQLIEKKVNHTVIYKVQGKSYLELSAEINELDPDFIICLQCNANDGKTSGTEVFYYQISEAGKKMARILLTHLTAHLQLPNRGTKAKTKNDEFGLLFRHTAAPCVIVKSFFMDNDNDVNRALENLEGLADAFANAIEDVSKMNLEHRPIVGDVFI